MSPCSARMFRLRRYRLAVVSTSIASVLASASAGKLPYEHISRDCFEGVYIYSRDGASSAL